MTATKFSSSAKADFQFRLYRNRKYSIFFFIMSILSAPLFLLGYTAYCSEYVHCFESYASGNYIKDISSFNELFSVVFIFSVIVMATIVVFIALKNFEYNISRPKTDMFLSLPINRNRRFISDYLSGLVSFAVPFLCSGVLLFIISLFSASVVKKTNDINGFDHYTLFKGYLPYTAFKYILVALLVLISLYTLTVLVINLCGTLTESLVFMLMVNLFIPLNIYSLNNLCIHFAYGVVATEPDYLITVTSPYGGASLILQHLGNMSGFNLYIKWMIPYLLVIAIMFGLAFIANRKRKAEDTGKPVVFRAFYSIVITIMIISIGAFAYLEFTESVLLIILFTAIVYFVAEVCVNRGFKKLYKGAIRYAITAVCIIAFFIVVDKTGCFGIADRVPESNNIKSVKLMCNSENNIIKTYYGDDMSFESYENIKAVIEVNKLIISDYKSNGGVDNKELKDSEQRNEYINITYILKSGKEIKRAYIVDGNTVKTLGHIYYSQEAMNKLVTSADRYGESEAAVNYNINNKTGKAYKFAIINKEQLKGLMMALRDDMLSIKNNIDVTDDSASEYYFEIEGFMGVQINREFKTTLAYLENIGIHLG